MSLEHYISEALFSQHLQTRDKNFPLETMAAETSSSTCGRAECADKNVENVTADLRDRTE